MVRQLEDLIVGEVVWISNLREYGKIEQIGPEPRSYIKCTSKVPTPYKEGKLVVSRGLCNPEINEMEKPVDVNREESDGQDDFKGFEMDKGTTQEHILKR
ncbi:hypothetical protein PR048_003835 [Dryococelus australis]|uniref:Uncharacterized protein n=1 Tax=Dryococelus australis TaxID=614101 RepID=A0ABQ9IP63_9NEOP|nr:hypothetical protein PR048_003835 [Dryococelus australis]